MLKSSPNQYENKIIESALSYLENRFRHSSLQLCNPKDIASYLQLQLADEKNEVFASIFLNNQLYFIAFEKLFYGTINESPVYPRKIVQRAIEYNAAAIVIAHNHPGGNCKPSLIDQDMTQSLKKALLLFDIRLIDHFIVSHINSFSFVENNLL